jgi:hypothetical protein
VLFKWIFKEQNFRGSSEGRRNQKKNEKACLKIINFSCGFLKVHGGGIGSNSGK